VAGQCEASPLQSCADIESVAVPRSLASRSSLAWSRTEKLVLALFVVAALASLAYLVHPWYDATNDGSMYIACARSIVAGEGYSYLGEPFRIRPPGLSYLIAPLIAWLGTDFYALNLYISLFGIAGTVLLHLFLRDRIGWVLALLVSVAVWLNPGYQRSCTQVMSEMPGMALMLLALLLERWASEARGTRATLGRETLLGVVIAAGCYVRSVNVLLLPALLLGRLGRRGARRDPELSWPRFAFLRLVPFAAVAMLLLLPWSIRNARAAPTSPTDQTHIYSYATGMFNVDPGDPRSPRRGIGDILGRVPLQTEKIVEVLGSRLKAYLPPRIHKAPLGNYDWSQEERRKYKSDRGLAVVATALVLLAGLLYVLLKRREPADVFVWCVLGTVAIYFDFGDRLVIVVYDLVARLWGGRIAMAVACAGLAAVIAIDFDPHDGWKRIEYQHQAFRDIAEAVEATLPIDARLGAPVGWHYSVYLDRWVYGLRPRPGGHPRVAALTMKQGRPVLSYEESIIDKYGLNTVVLSQQVPADRIYVDYFARRNVWFRNTGPAYVVRVRR
jgi:xanthosine utilization system XapX-like protein